MVHAGMERKTRTLRERMNENTIGRHHLERIDEIARATRETAVDVLARALVELGPDPSAGALTGWLFEERQRLGLEPKSAHVDKPEHIIAWQAVEEAADTWPRFDPALLALDEEEVGA